jgi:Cu/Ag efflux protein CusF
VKPPCTFDVHPKEAYMIKAMAGAVALTLAVLGAAQAADIEGKIKSIDTDEKSFTLEDGTKVWVGEGVSMDSLKEGSDVKASYSEQEGKNVATSVEVKD